MLSGISVISVAKPHLSSSLPAVQYVCCKGRCSRFTEGWCQVVIITPVPLLKLRCGHLWFHCCLRDVPSFFFLLLLQYPCVYISFLSLFLPQPSVSPCVSPLPPLCWQAARSYGRRRGNVWHFLWGFCLPCRPCSFSEAEGGLSVVSLSAFHLCCDGMKSY